MTGRGKNTFRIETEIEKSREESNWKKVIELAEQLKARSNNHECLSNFLIGEGKLESYLEEWPPIKENIERAGQDLTEAHKYLKLAASDLGKKVGVALDAYLLLGKLNYACGHYEAALENYLLAELNALTEKELPVRSLRIVAESYAINGLCLEQTALSGSSRYKQAERDAEMTRCFELSADLTLLYLQRTGTEKNVAGRILETALQRAPILHMKTGRLQGAVDTYREMLTAIESPSTQALRLTLTRQLAEVLLRGVSGTVYGAPAISGTLSNQGTMSRRKENGLADRPWKPKKYSGLNQFVPNNECEETILLLLIGEAMAVRDAVLSQSPEFSVARHHAYDNATAIYDLLTIATVRWGQVCLLNESLERAMKFSFDEAHVWRQRALCTAAAVPVSCPSIHTDTPQGKTVSSAAIRAKAVMTRAIALRPKDSALRVLAAKTCYQMSWIEEGLQFSESALAIEEQDATFMLSRCHLYVGIGHHMKAQTSNVKNEKQTSNDKCLSHFLKAVELDPNDHLALYYLAAQHAHLGHLSAAMDAVRASLSARAEGAAALRLLVVLCGRRAEALAVAARARAERPACEWLARAHALLQLRWEGGESALATGKEYLSSLKSLDTMDDQLTPYQEIDTYSDSRSVLHYQNDADSNKDANSVRAASVAASRVERALSEAATSVSGARAVTAPANAARARAWLLLADLCLKLSRANAASECVTEAANLMPFSHQVMHMRGMVHAFKEEYEEARQCFQNAIAIHPTYVDSIIELGVCHHKLGWYRLGEKVLREAARLDSARPQLWEQLGLVLQRLEQHDAAADCMATALQIQTTATLLPLSSLPYVFE